VSAKGVLRATAVGTGIAIMTAGAALAATPLPEKGKAYGKGTITKDRLVLTLVTSKSNPKKIVSGVPALSQIAHSGGFLQCPNSHKIAEFPFPGATLKLSGGKYGFSVTENKTNPPFLGAPITGTLKLVIKGTVASPTRITGTLKASGICTASVDFSLPVTNLPI
jgi:hypothetical protein